MNHEVDDPEKVTKSLSLLTYDREEKEYVTWFFQSSGLIGRMSGKWSPQGKAFHWTADDPPPNTTGTITEAFFADTLRGSLNYTDAGGQKMFAMEWTRKRKKGALPDFTQQLWSKIETPIQPIPAEMKKLQPLVGEWEAEYTQQPSILFPEGGQTEATIKGEWILDGRFFLGRANIKQYQTIWVIGYDTEKKTYRYVRFDDRGAIEENVGNWKEDTRTFEWKTVNGKPGMTKQSVTRLIGSKLGSVSYRL